LTPDCAIMSVKNGFMKIVLIISYTKLNFYLEPIYGNMYVNK